MGKLTFPDPWPELDAAKAELTAARGKVAAVKRRKLVAEAIIAGAARNRVDALARLAADPDQDGAREIVQIDAQAAEARVAVEIADAALPIAEKGVEQAVEAVEQVARVPYRALWLAAGQEVKDATAALEAAKARKAEAEAEMQRVEYPVRGQLNAFVKAATAEPEA